MKRFSQILTVVMGVFAGVFLGRVVFLIWDYRAHPELYASWSAPWYVQLLVPGIATVCVLLLCGAGKWAISRHLKKKP